MDLSELLSKGWVKKSKPDAEMAKKLVEAAARDLETAEINLKAQQHDWALAIAYNAMLSAGRALMAQKGFYASSETHHLAVVKFCAAAMPPESAQLVAMFNRYRIRRHEVVYGESGPATQSEAQNAINGAGRFVSIYTKHREIGAS